MRDTAADLEDVVPWLHVRHVHPLAVDVVAVGVPAAHGDPLVAHVVAGEALLLAWVDGGNMLIMLTGRSLHSTTSTRCRVDIICETTGESLNWTLRSITLPCSLFLQRKRYVTKVQRLWLTV